MQNNKQQIILIIFLLLPIGIISGCATTQTVDGDPDPLEPFNRPSYTFTDTLDRHLLKPIAETYVELTPEFVRTGITNFFDNLNYLNVALNSFLQGKFDQGLSDLVRFIFNSTIGLAGLVDVATPMGLPEHNEDLGQTLAVWGFSQGPYLFIPVKGPDTVRNLPNTATRTLLNPLTYVTGAILFPLTAVDVINQRANAIEATNIRDEAAVDPYTFTREAYIQRREYLIYDGNPPVEGYDDIFENDLSGEGSGNTDVLVIE